jgi:hypothetical protein
MWYLDLTPIASKQQSKQKILVHWLKHNMDVNDFCACWSSISFLFYNELISYFVNYYGPLPFNNVSLSKNLQATFFYVNTKQI